MALHYGDLTITDNLILTESGGNTIIQGGSPGGNVTVTLPSSTGTLALSSDIPAPTGDGIYSGNGIIPSTTVATITDNISFNGGEFRTQNGYWQGTAKILYINPGATTSNLFVGESAGNGTMTGDYNIGVGYSALASNTTGVSNMANGFFCLNKNTTGSYNVAIGQQTLTTNISGSNNIGIGYISLRFNLASNNTAIGHRTLEKNTSGTENVAIGLSGGLSALSENTTGVSNIAIGGSLYNNTTGSYNIGMGQYSLGTATTSSNNVAIGYFSLTYATTGSQTAVGVRSLEKTTTGLQNTAIGFSSLRENITGSYNTAVGYKSLIANTVGSNNVALGLQAGFYETGSNKLFIDNTSRASEEDGRAKALIYGVFDAATTNQYVNLNANTNIPLGQYNYMAASNSADTIGDVRTYATFVSGTGISTFYIEKCIEASATKGGGVWDVITSFAL